jgi:hypothetical protein
MVPETTTTTPASKVTPRCIVVVSSSGPWRLMCAPRAQIIGEDDPRAEDDIVSDMHAFKDHHLVLACDRSPTDAPFSTNAPSQTLQSRPMRAAARTWANAQTRVPYPTLVLSQSPSDARGHRTATAKPSPHHQSRPPASLAPIMLPRSWRISPAGIEAVNRALARSSVRSWRRTCGSS